MPEQRLFLERRSYRMRRMMDAIRLLPVLGLCLWLVPVLWPRSADGADAAISTSTALMYIFSIWMGLGLISWVLWLRTRRSVAGQSDQSTVFDAPEPR